MQRSAFADALTWLEIHGDAPDMLAVLARAKPAPAAPAERRRAGDAAGPRRGAGRRTRARRPSRAWRGFRSRQAPRSRI